MHEQGTLNNMWCDEAHIVEGTEKREDKMGEFPGEGLPILVHIERFEGSPVLADLLQREIVWEIVNGCIQKYPMNIDTLNEYECIITMPKELVASIVAQDLQKITQWGGICANIQCTIASHSKIKSIVSDREKDQAEVGQGATVSQQVSSELQIEDLMNRMMMGIMMRVDEKLKAICDSNLPRVSNQSFATDKVCPSLEMAPVSNSLNFLRGGAT